MTIPRKQSLQSRVHVGKYTDDYWYVYQDRRRIEHTAYDTKGLARDAANALRLRIQPQQQQP